MNVPNWIGEFQDWSLYLLMVRLISIGDANKSNEMIKHKHIWYFEILVGGGCNDQCCVNGVKWEKKTTNDNGAHRVDIRC